MGTLLLNSSADFKDLLKKKIEIGDVAHWYIGFYFEMDVRAFFVFRGRGVLGVL